MYEFEASVNLTDLLPWATEDSVDNVHGFVIRFNVRATSTDTLEEGQRVAGLIKSWQPSISEPVVIGAETDPYVLKELGIKKGGVNVVVNTPAGEETGEDEGTTIPAVNILGTLGAGAALAGAASGNGDDDRKKRSSFKMYINKNFGNSLKKGAEPQAVFARIVEVKPCGQEVPRPDLTAQIRVYSSDDSLIVKDGGMNNGYKCAMASVYDMEDQPPEGKVSFFFEGEGGTFTQNVIFNIAVPGIKFFQSNLTLPAAILEEPEFLPFEVSEMGDKYTVEVSYNGEDYEVDMTDCDAPEAKDVHYAVLMEKNKQPLDAGVYTESWVNVTVKNETQELKGSIKIIRMGMGLCLPVNALNCYRVPKKESVGKEMKSMTPSDFESSITETVAYVLYYDEEKSIDAASMTSCF